MNKGVPKELQALVMALERGSYDEDLRPFTVVDIDDILTDEVMLKMSEDFHNLLCRGK
jgi:hypothetical protein